MVPKVGKAVKDAVITLARQKVHRTKQEHSTREEEGDYGAAEEEDNGGRRGQGRWKRRKGKGRNRN